MKRGTEVQLLTWDSEWLGFPVARLVVGADDSVPVVSTTIAQCRASGIKLLYLLVNPTHPAASAAAQAAGGWLADVRLTYRLLLASGTSLVPLPPGIALAMATEFTPSLEELAWRSGEYSRFRRDARIGDVAFQALYTRWLHQVLADGLVWVATMENEKVAGMLAFEARDHEMASIALLAVAPTARRRHVGQCLVQMAQQQARYQGCSELRVVTQGVNQLARQFYEQFGFKLLSTEHYYHLWL